MSSASESGADALRIYGNLSLLEMAPVLLAAEEIYPAKTVARARQRDVALGRSRAISRASVPPDSRDIATNSETQALRASVDHPDLRFIFTVAECPYRIVARRSAGIGSLADLRGKRVGTQLNRRRRISWIACCAPSVSRRTMSSACRSWRKPRRRSPRCREALRSGEIDAVALWEPQVQSAKLAIGDDAIEFRDPAVYTEKFNLCTHAGQSRRSCAAEAHRRLRAGADRGRAAPEGTIRRAAGGSSPEPRGWISKPSGARGLTSTTPARWRPTCWMSSNGRSAGSRRSQGRAPRSARGAGDAHRRQCAAGGAEA